MGINLEDIIPAVECTIKMQRNGNYFQVSIVGKDGTVFQDLQGYNILDGDVLQINGMAFRVTFDGIEWTPPLPSEKLQKIDTPHMPQATLKRKMDIDASKH